jgi:hypothetical protein
MLYTPTSWEGLMQYMLLIHSSEDGWNALSEAEQNEMYAGYGAFTQAIKEKGAFLGGDQLASSGDATTVRVRDGETLVTDGPFAETKEQLGGYYLIEAESIDEAIEWAAKIPGAKYGVIEVRPVVMQSAEVAG